MFDWRDIAGTILVTFLFITLMTLIRFAWVMFGGSYGG